MVLRLQTRAIISVMSSIYTHSIIAGSTSSVDIYLDIENAGDDAFQAILSFILPASTLQLVNIFKQTKRGEVSGYIHDIILVKILTRVAIYSYLA